jgi:hypothetical protein
MIAFLLDENVDTAYQQQLRRHDASLTVWAVGDPGAPLKGTLDPEILHWCETHGFMLVTNNRASMPVHLAEHLAQGGHVPGILLFQAAESMGLILDNLLLIAAASLEEEFRDHIVYLPF